MDELETPPDPIHWGTHTWTRCELCEGRIFANTFYHECGLVDDAGEVSYRYDMCLCMDCRCLKTYVDLELHQLVHKNLYCTCHLDEEPEELPDSDLT